MRPIEKKEQFETEYGPGSALILGADPSKAMSSIIDDVSNGRVAIANDEVRCAVAAAGMQSLWFFLKYVAGFNGPFNLLNTDLHRDMCNFRQSDYCMADGVWAGVFMPRKHYKTTIFTDGGTAWEGLRDGNLCFRFVNAVVDRAMDFMHTVQRIFDANEFFAWLYPWAVARRGQDRWNDKEAVFTHRTRHFTEPSIKCGGVEGAAAGDHHDVLVFDDLIDQTMLNAMHQAGTDIEKAKSFMKTATRTLVRSWQHSRCICAATRYAIDDCYEPVWDGARMILGYRDERYKLAPKGRWVIYYRVAKEDDSPTPRIIFPEAITEEGLAEMARDDWWTYATQYMNNPFDAGGAELISFNHKLVELDVDEDRRWYFRHHNSERVYLDNCDGVIACDPAATEANIKARTSRSAVVAMYRDSKRRTYLAQAHAGFVVIFSVFDWIFGLHDKFGTTIRKAIFENAAFQKVLKPLLDQECVIRKKWLRIEGLPAAGDKDGRIRARMIPELQGGRLYIVKEYDEMFRAEKNVFPQSKRKDLLDAMEKAMAALTTPETEEEEEEKINEEERWLNAKGRNKTTGY